MMGCTGRSFLLTICSLQLVVVIECQAFDFMGFMYGPILANFFHIIFIILGFFGAFQFHFKYILTYTLWNLLWVGWCIFVICFYLDAGSLDKDSDVLNLGTGSRSWWEVNGPGCVPDFTTPANYSVPDPDPSRPPRPTHVDGCWLPYFHVEAIQAFVQLVLSIVGIVGGVVVSKYYLDDDDGSGPFGFVYINARENAVEMKPMKTSVVEMRGNKTQVPYRPLTFTSVDEYLPPAPPNKLSGSRPSLYGADLTAPGYGPAPHAQANGYGVQPASPRPMTPRRVKRRSVQARDSTMSGMSTMGRSSQRRSARSRASQRRRAHQSPVSKLLDQQNRFLDSSMDEGQPQSHSVGYTNPVFHQSSNSSINHSVAEEVYRPQSARSSYSNYHASRPISYLHNNQVFSNQAVAQVPINTNRASSKRARADLPRSGPVPGPSSFLAQGPPAYREGKDETAI